MSDLTQRSVGNRRHISEMQYRIVQSKLCKEVKDNVAGNKNSMPWKKRYKFNDSDIYIYLTKKDEILFREGVKGLFLTPEEVWSRSKEDIRLFIEQLGLLQKAR